MKKPTWLNTLQQRSSDKLQHDMDNSLINVTQPDLEQPARWGRRAS